MKRLPLALLLLTLPLSAQIRRHDPLTPGEINKVRDATEDPGKRIKLFAKFAQERMLTITELQKNSKSAPDRGQQTHDLLENFAAIVDELDSNIDMFDRQGADLRDALGPVIAAYNEWQEKLKLLKQQPAADRKPYDFILETAIESVDEGLDSARETLSQQKKSMAEAKKKK